MLLFAKTNKDYIVYYQVEGVHPHISPCEPCVSDLKKKALGNLNLIRTDVQSWS